MRCDCSPINKIVCGNPRSGFWNPTVRYWASPPLRIPVPIDAAIRIASLSTHLGEPQICVGFLVMVVTQKRRDSQNTERVVFVATLPNQEQHEKKEKCRADRWHIAAGLAGRGLT
jgi:hypothetical protein